MNQMMKHLALHHQRIPLMGLPPRILFHSSDQNRLAEVIQNDGNHYHQ